MLAAVKSGDAKVLAELIRQDPGFDVNMDQTGYGNTLLHFACGDSSRSAVISLLLAHPDIDINVKNKYGSTPFYWACFGYPSCVREMLKDSRVKVNEPNDDGYTPLWFAAFSGHIDVIKWWIASGREIDLGEPGDYFTDAIGVARNEDKIEVVALLERFQSDATQTRHAVRVELDLLDELAAEMFALVVFVSDGLLQISVACSQVLLHCRPASFGTPNGALLSPGWISQGDYLWKGQRRGIQGLARRLW